MGVHYVQAALALAPHPDQAGTGQHVQVLRHRLLADVEVRADLAHRPRLVADQAEHLLPARLGEGTQHRLPTHATSVARPVTMFKYWLVQVCTCTMLGHEWTITRRRLGCGPR